MALARVQGTGKVGAVGASVAATFATPPSVGQGLIVLVVDGIVGSTGFDIGGCVDAHGNTYTRALNQPNSARSIGACIYFCPRVTATGAPFTVTVTPALAGSHRLTLSVIAFSGVGDTGLLLDRVAGFNGQATTISPGALPGALTADEEILAAVWTSNITITGSAVQADSPAWTEEFEELDVVTHAPGEGDTRLVTGALGTTPTVSWAVTGGTPRFSTVFATFKPTATTAPPAGGESTQGYIWGPL